MKQDEKIQKLDLSIGIPPTQTVTIKFNFSELIKTFTSYERNPARIDRDGYLELAKSDLLNKIEVDPGIVAISSGQTVIWKLEQLPATPAETASDFFLDSIDFLNNWDAYDVFEALPAQTIGEAVPDTKIKMAHVKQIEHSIFLMYSVKFTFISKSGWAYKVKFDPIIQSHIILTEFIDKKLIKDLLIKKEITNFIFATKDPIYDEKIVDGKFKEN